MSLKESSAALILYESLPPEVRKEWGPKKVRAITGNIMAAEKTRELYQDMWSLVKKHLTWKKVHGFCASSGELGCMNRPAEGESMCSNCRAKAQSYYRNGSKRENKTSAYGQWRAVQRAIEKAERG